MRVEEIVDRVVARFIGTKHERDVKRLTPTVAAINALAPIMNAWRIPISRQNRSS